MSLSVRLLRSAATASRAADTNAAERVAQETGLFLRMVRDLRRIHSHLASFAYPALNRQRTASNLRAALNGGSGTDAAESPVASVPLPQPPGDEEDG
jgi:phosphate:Na+ symporter